MRNKVDWERFIVLRVLVVIGIVLGAYSYSQGGYLGMFVFIVLFSAIGCIQAITKR